MCVNTMPAGGELSNDPIHLGRVIWSSKDYLYPFIPIQGQGDLQEPISLGKRRGVHPGQVGQGCMDISDPFVVYHSTVRKISHKRIKHLR